jgi:hypothetical protein
MARDAEWPEWWDWELDLDLDHLRERMVSRKFSETELREMLEQATAIHEDDEPGRWRIDTTRDRQPWEVVVEPQLDERVLLVITAYRVESL